MIYFISMIILTTYDFVRLHYKKKKNNVKIYPTYRLLIIKLLFTTSDQIICIFCYQSKKELKILVMGAQIKMKFSLIYLVFDPYL